MRVVFLHSESSIKGVKGCCFSDTFCSEKLRGKEWLLYFLAGRCGGGSGDDSVEAPVVPISWNGSRLRILESTAGGSRWSSCPIDDRLEVDLENDAGETAIELVLQKSGLKKKFESVQTLSASKGKKVGKSKHFGNLRILNSNQKPRKVRKAWKAKKRV